MCPIVSSSTKSASSRACMKFITGGASGSRSFVSAGELGGDLGARVAGLDHRLVHVEVDQAHLGVGDLGELLAVDTHQLHQRRRGKPASSTAAA